MDRAAFERVVEVLAVRRGAVDQGRIVGAERRRMAERAAGPAGVGRRQDRLDIIAAPRRDAQARDVQHEAPGHVLAGPGNWQGAADPGADGLGDRGRALVRRRVHGRHTPNTAEYLRFVSSVAAASSSAAERSSLTSASLVRPGFSCTAGWNDRRLPTSDINCWHGWENR